MKSLRSTTWTWFYAYFHKRNSSQILIKLIVLYWITVKTILLKSSSCTDMLALLFATRSLMRRMIEKFMSALSIFILKFDTVINLMTLSNVQSWHSTKENSKNIYIVITVSSWEECQAEIAWLLSWQKWNISILMWILSISKTVVNEKIWDMK